MNHWAVGDGDRHFPPHPAIGADNDVANDLAVAAIITDGMEFPIVGIAMRMRRKTAELQAAIEVAVRDGAQQTVDFDRQAAGFDKRQQLAGMADDVGVDSVGALIARPRRWRFAECSADAVRADIAVTIPQRLAALQPHAMDHAVAGEPMVEARVGGRDRVRSDAEVHAVEFGGQGAGHRQRRGGHFVGDRRVNALQKGIGLDFCLTCHFAISR